MDDAGVAGELVYSNDDWTSPELAFFTDNPISVPAGSGFEFRCSFENTGDSAVSYGYETSDEMCMMVGVYYPDDGFKVCSKNP